MTGLLFVLSLAAILGSGLMAGLFFAFSVTVMKALGQRPAAQGIAAMQAINVTIINPLFLGVFFGTAILCTLLLTLAIMRWPLAGGALLAGGSLCYLLGTFLVTILCNVPRNNRLAGLVPEAPESAAIWADYLDKWTAWNHVRTLAGLLAMALLMAGLYLAAAA